MPKLPKPPTAPKPNPIDASYIMDLTPEPREFNAGFPLPHHMTYAAVWQAITKSYRSRSDEAKKDNYENALAMRRDAFIMKNLRARQYPTVELPFTIEVEDKDDPEQQQVSEDLTLMVNAIPKFQLMKLHLLEGIWFGKAAVQMEWAYKTINGIRRLVPTNHLPVNGDKIQFKWDGTPGVMVYKPYQPKDTDISMSDFGPCLWLDDPYYRDRFIIHEFEPDDTDYLFESDLAGAIHGTGLRSRIYWVYQVRHQILGWIVDSLQRISTNGMLVGYYPAGNTQAQKSVEQALLDLINKSVTTFATDPGGENVTRIESIEPSTVAYDTLLANVAYYDDIMEVMFLGQKLSSSVGSTGMGSDVATLHSQTFERVIRYDAQNLSETLTKDLLGPLIKYNYGELPFQVKLTLQIEKTNVKDILTGAKALYEMGVSLDEQDLRNKAGFIAPRDSTEAIKAPEPEPFDIGQQNKTGELDNETETQLSKFTSGDNCGISSGGFQPGNDCAAGEGGSEDDDDDDIPDDAPEPEEAPDDDEGDDASPDYANVRHPKVKDLWKDQKQELKDKLKEHKEALRDKDREIKEATKDFAKDQKSDAKEFAKDQKSDAKDFLETQEQELKDHHLEWEEYEPEEKAEALKDFLETQQQEREDFATDQSEALEVFLEEQKEAKQVFDADQADDRKQLEEYNDDEYAALIEEHDEATSNAMAEEEITKEDGDKQFVIDDEVKFEYSTHDTGVPEGQEEPPSDSTEQEWVDYWKSAKYRIIDEDGAVMEAYESKEELDERWDELLHDEY